MACCGGGGGVRPQRIRKQSVESPTKQSVAPTQRKLTRTTRTAQAATPQRQYVVPRQQCTKCGYPGMVVTIAGRERMQCSNVNCRLIIN